VALGLLAVLGVVSVTLYGSHAARVQRRLLTPAVQH
jgi:YNFM family putative membrane transporter